jgi:TatA/E family protein of Tat protein translocase
MLAANPARISVATDLHDLHGSEFERSGTGQSYPDDLQSLSVNPIPVHPRASVVQAVLSGPDAAPSLLPRLSAGIIEFMNLGMPEMIFIFLLALVIFGPKKLPELGRQLGKALAEFKKASNDFKNQLEVEMMNIELEERAKKPESERSILSVEKLFETISGPAGSVSRGTLEPYTVPPTTVPPTDPASPVVEPAAPAAEAALPPAETPVNGNARVAPDA